MVLMTVKDVRNWKWLFLACFMLWRVQPGHLLKCYCHHSHPPARLSECVRNNDTCTGTRVTECTYVRELVMEDGESREDEIYGCLQTLSFSITDELCFIRTATLDRKCCSEHDFCNRNLTSEPFLTPSSVRSAAATPSVSPTTVVATGALPSRGPLYRRVTIAVPVCSAVIILVILVATPMFLYLLRRRKRRIEHLRSESHQLQNGDREPSPVFSPYSVDTLDLQDQTCTSGSGSGAPLLTQRTIARCIRVGDPIGSGRFGQVFVGAYQGDKVAVKKFASRDEKSWFRETEVYSTVSLRHDNILGFIASDVFSNSGATELWLVTQYHPHGSLYDYINRQSVSPRVMMKMAISTCKGLTHLHTEFFGTSAKPAIAHRDIKSKNILVKSNLECCLADFGLAVMRGPSSSVNFPTNPKQGTKRYMAPEILAVTIDMKRLEAFQKADIYAFGLVLWEICKRCADKNDPVGEYEPPFHGMVGPDPTFEEMNKVVVMDRQKPTIPAHWHSDDLLHNMAGVMKECWYFNSNARNNALFYKLKLQELAREDKLDYDVQE